MGSPKQVFIVGEGDRTAMEGILLLQCVLLIAGDDGTSPLGAPLRRLLLMVACFVQLHGGWRHNLKLDSKTHKGSLRSGKKKEKMGEVVNTPPRV